MEKVSINYWKLHYTQTDTSNLSILNWFRCQLLLLAKKIILGLDINESKITLT